MPNPADIMNLSDEDILAMDTPPEYFSEESAAPVEEPVQEEQVAAETPEELPAEGLADEGVAPEGGAEGDDEAGKEPEAASLSDAELLNAPTPVAVAEPVAAKEVVAPVVAEEAPPIVAPPVVAEGPALDHKSEYEKLIGVPISANGKKITLKNTDEALRLIQQGAGYAQKMEQLKPARKSAAMLEAAGLLGDEVALAQMIDLFRGDPKAIAKMLKETNTDVFSLDLEAGESYTPNSHLQSDAAVTFTDTLKEIRTLEGGREAMALIDNMDVESRNLIWGNPEAIRDIYEYKRSGVYDTVATELERRRTLGQIPEGVPYIVAFQRVGEEIAKAQEAETASRSAAEQFRNPPVAEPAKPVPRAPVATGVAPRKLEAPNAQAVAAAAPRAGGGRAKTSVDIYSLSDADIEKMSSFPG
jgi:hypothetical protein